MAALSENLAALKVSERGDRRHRRPLTVTLGTVQAGGNGPLAGRVFCTTPIVAGTLDAGAPHPVSNAAVIAATISLLIQSFSLCRRFQVKVAAKPRWF